MQLRIFNVAGNPFVAARNGYLETHGSLGVLLASHMPDVTANKGDVAVEAPTQEAALAPDVQPSPTEVAPSEADVEPADTVGPLLPQPKRAPAKQKVPRRPAAKPRQAPSAASTSTEATEALSFVADGAPNEEAPLGASEAHDISAAVDAREEDGSVERAAGRTRVGHPVPPRWKIAGRLRRGRPT
jgi:hypothetical protein